MNTDRGLLGFAYRVLVVLVAIPLAIAVIPIALVWIAVSFAVTLPVLVIVWFTWSVKGKDLLVVYSDSPIWQAYFESGLLPRVSPRAEILNWSQRSCWPVMSLKRIVFDRFKKDKEFVPVVMKISPFGWPEQVRLFRAFHDCKHGKPQTMKQMESDLSRMIGEAIELGEYYPQKE